jgi:hypothetical protein
MDSGTDHDSTCDQANRHQPTRRVVLGIGIGLYLLSVGGLVGVLVERIRFDHRRASVLARYDTLLPCHPFQFSSGSNRAASRSPRRSA